MPCDFSKMVQLLKMLRPALPGTYLHLAHGPVSLLTSRALYGPSSLPPKATQVEADRPHALSSCLSPFTEAPAAGPDMST